MIEKLLVSITKRADPKALASSKKFKSKSKKLKRLFGNGNEYIVIAPSDKIKSLTVIKED